jgi:PBSX family phage portal protein
MNRWTAPHARPAQPKFLEVTTMSETETVAITGNVQLYEFGDPEPVLSRRDLLSHIECRFNNRWYAPPIPMEGLTRAFYASPHHNSAISIKRNLLVSSFVPSKWLSRHEFSGLALDYLTLGNGYLEVIHNRVGRPMTLNRVIGKYVRRGKDNQYFQVQGWNEEHAFADGSICHIAQPCLDQEIYGVPEYLSALQSALLNENATLFRRRYYENGSHAGYILHLAGQFGEQDVNSVREALKRSKGPGNFRNMLLTSTGGEKDSAKLIPISEVAAKDEFLGIKNTTRDDVLAAHRVPPQLIGVVPQNAGGFGDMAKAVSAFALLEITPLQMQLMEINEKLGVEAVVFNSDAFVQPNSTH